MPMWESARRQLERVFAATRANAWVQWQACTVERPVWSDATPRAGGAVRWDGAAKGWEWGGEVAIFVAEVRAAGAVLRWASRVARRGVRFVLYIDNMGAAWAWAKAGASAEPVSAEIRRVHAILTARGQSVRVVWVPSRHELADTPSRVADSRRPTFFDYTNDVRMWERPAEAKDITARCAPWLPLVRRC